MLFIVLMLLLPFSNRQVQGRKMEARAPHPRFSLIKADYDKDHQAKALSKQ
jgi:hypothetical protein